MELLLRAADAAEALLAAIARYSSWLMIVLMAVICFDIGTRKVGFQLPGMGSTRLQELEWHLHAVIFSGWLGYCYLLNSHPRVDTVTAHLDFRKRAWVELIGCLLFALPYAFVCVIYGFDLARDSFRTGEGSDAVIGIPMRWVIKSLFFGGLVLLLVSVMAMTVRLIAYHAGWRSKENSGLPLDRVIDPM
jgi:TRAP-type mannitol/chloroaromatic compound transport system permease small subunit